MDDAAERLGAGVEQRPPGVVLEPRQQAHVSGLELALEQDVADHPRFARDRLMGKNPGPRHERPVAAAIAATEKLVATADGEERSSAGDGRSDLLTARREVDGDRRLLAILAAADVHEVVIARRQRLAEPDRVDDELVAAQRRAAREHGDVPAIGIDVQVVRIQVPDADPHGRPPSQYGFTSRRRVRIPRSASIAV